MNFDGYDAHTRVECYEVVMDFMLRTSDGIFG